MTDGKQPWFEHAEYANVERTVDALWYLHSEPFVASARRYLKAPRPWGPNLKALDIGCGAGQGALLLNLMGYEVTALDRNGAAADVLARRNVRFVKCHFNDFRCGYAPDLICVCDFLEHTENPAGILKLCRGWISPAGLLYVTVPLEGRRTRNPYHFQAWGLSDARKLLGADFSLVADWTQGIDYGGIWRPKVGGTDAAA